MTPDHISLHLELNHRDGLVHLGRKPRIHRVIYIFVKNFGHKPGARIILIDLGREHGQRPQIDAITVLQHIKAVVADSNPQYIAYTG